MHCAAQRLLRSTDAGPQNDGVRSALSLLLLSWRSAVDTPLVCCSDWSKRLMRACSRRRVALVEVSETKLQAESRSSQKVTPWSVCCCFQHALDDGLAKSDAVTRTCCLSIHNSPATFAMSSNKHQQPQANRLQELRPPNVPSLHDHSYLALHLTCSSGLQHPMRLFQTKCMAAYSSPPALCLRPCSVCEVTVNLSAPPAGMMLSAMPWTTSCRRSPTA